MSTRRVQRSTGKSFRPKAPKRGGKKGKVGFKNFRILTDAEIRKRELKRIRKKQKAKLPQKPKVARAKSIQVQGATTVGRKSTWHRLKKRGKSKTVLKSSSVKRKK